MLDDTPPFFDFSPLKSRTFQIILRSTFVASFGLFTPIIMLVRIMCLTLFDRATFVASFGLFTPLIMLVRIMCLTLFDTSSFGLFTRVGHRVLLRSERILLLRSFKARNILLCSFFEFLATYQTQKNDAFFS